MNLEYKGSLGRELCLQLAGLWLICATVTFAQSPTADDFNPNITGAASASHVYTVVAQPDGKILLGGTFNTIAGQTRNRIARVNADGSLDTGFNPNANGSVNSMVVQSDGTIIVGGNFTQIGNRTFNRIGKLNANGSPASGFGSGISGSSQAVNSLVVQADGKVVAGGSFTNLLGQSRNRLARLNADGTLDLNFNPGANDEVLCLAVQPDGKILAGGTFTNIAGGARARLARLDINGNLDAAFSLSADLGVYLLATQGNGKVLVGGGGFYLLGGQTRYHFVRLNADGTLDGSFIPGPTLSINSVAEQADGGILIGGFFSTVAGQPRKKLARLHANGTLDTSFDPGASDVVFALAAQADGKILVGGDFATLGGQTRNRIGRLNQTGAATQTLSLAGSTLTWMRGMTSPEVLLTTFEHSTNGINWMLLGNGTRISGGWELTNMIVADGLVRARGHLTSGKGNGSASFVETMLGTPIITNQPASRTNNAGTTATFAVQVVGSDLTFRWQKNGAPLENGADIVGATNSTLILSNILKSAEGDYTVVVTNFDGSITSAVATLTVIDPAINTQPADANRDPGQSVTFSILAGGTEPHYLWLKDGLPLPPNDSASMTITNLQAAHAGFYAVVISNQYGSVTSTWAELSVNLATLDAGFNPGLGGFPSAVYSTAVQPGGNIFVSGWFTQLAGQPRYYLGRLDPVGLLDNSFNPGSDAYVNCLVIQADGKLLLGGGFMTVSNQPRSHIGRLNLDGTVDNGFDPGTSSPVEALALQQDGMILVAQNSGLISRIGANGPVDSGFAAQANGSVYALALQTNGMILVGGSFTNLNGQARASLGRLNTNGTLDNGFNPGTDGNVNTIVVQSDGKILIGGWFSTLGGQPRNALGRLNPNGSVDQEFDPNVLGSEGAWISSIVSQTDGKIVFGGNVSLVGGHPRKYIARILADGTLDSEFNPGADGKVYSLAVQADGKILAGGGFYIFGGQPRNRIARLNNTGPATQSLNCSSSVIRWLRGGTSPEVWRATFDFWNGGSWVELGAGTRITNGWELSGLSLSPGAAVRARGYTTGGGSNGSGWYAEAFALVPGPPQFNRSTAPPTLGVNGFSARIENLSGQGPLVVYAATNLADWMPVLTNPAGPLAFDFLDPAATNFPQRFYRAAEQR